MLILLMMLMMIMIMLMMIHAREKKERMNDPNIEYVDMDDFRPGGKYGPKEGDGTATPGSSLDASSQKIMQEELQKASQVVATAIKVGRMCRISFYIIEYVLCA